MLFPVGAKLHIQNKRPVKTPNNSSRCPPMFAAVAMFVFVMLAATAIPTTEARRYSMEDVFGVGQQQQWQHWRSPSGLAPSFVGLFNSAENNMATPIAISTVPDQQQQQTTVDENTVDAEEVGVPSSAGSGHQSPQKRRLVVRVPFAQNPDNLQLSRIYKSLFDPSQQSRAKKYGLEAYGLRRYVPFF